MALDRHRILNELGSVINQLQSADCGCMGRLFNNTEQKTQPMNTSTPCGNTNNWCASPRHGCCHGYGNHCTSQSYPTSQGNKSMMPAANAQQCVGHPCLGGQMYNTVHHHMSNMNTPPYQVTPDSEKLVLDPKVLTSQIQHSHQNPLNQYNQRMVKFNESFPGAMKGLDSHKNFDPMEVALQLSRTNQDKVDEFMKSDKEKQSNNVMSLGNTVQNVSAANTNQVVTSANAQLSPANGPTNQLTNVQMGTAANYHQSEYQSIQNQQNKGNIYGNTMRLPHQQVYSATGDPNRNPRIEQGPQSMIANSNIGQNIPHSEMQNLHNFIINTQLVNSPEYEDATSRPQNVPENLEMKQNQAIHSGLLAVNQAMPLQVQYQPSQYNQQMIDPNTDAVITQPIQPTDYHSNPEGLKMQSIPENATTPTISPTLKNPIFPVDNSRFTATYNNYNTLGQPIEMIPAAIFKPEPPSLPQTLSPQPAPMKIRNEPELYSNVKSTVSKTSLMGNKGEGRMPGQLQHVYNQYKGSQSLTQQNIKGAVDDGSYSDRRLNVQTNSPRHIPVERTGGDTSVDTNKTNQLINNAMGVIGDVLASKPAREVSPDKASIQRKVRNGLQDMVYTSYPSSAAWSFHGDGRSYSPRHQLRNK